MNTASAEPPDRSPDRPAGHGFRPDFNAAPDPDLVAELTEGQGPPARTLAAAGELARRAVGRPDLFRTLFDDVLPDPRLYTRASMGLTAGRMLLAELTTADRAAVAAEFPVLLDRLAAAGVSTTGWASWLGLS